MKKYLAILSMVFASTMLQGFASETTEEKNDETEFTQLIAGDEKPEDQLNPKPDEKCRRLI